MELMMILLISFSLNLNAQTYMAGKSVDQILKLKKDSTLKIEIRDDVKKESHVSTGFFVGRDGRFVTVHHDLRDYYFSNKNTKIKISNLNGEEYFDYVFEGCSNDNKIDICTGKILSIKSTPFFEAIGNTHKQGDIFTSIGHCTEGQKEEYSVKKGEIKLTTNNYQYKFNRPTDSENRNTLLIEVNLKRCVGDSGGPLFDPFTGALIGMYSFGLKDHYFAISSLEISKLLQENMNKVFMKADPTRILTDLPCVNIRPGTREYDNCKLFE